MNILQTGLALTLFVTTRGEVKRELGFTGIGSYHGGGDPPSLRYASGGSFVNEHFNQGGKLLQSGSYTRPFHIGSSGFGKSVLGFTSIGGYNGGSSLLRGGHQGYGGFNLNSGHNIAPLFNPTVIQPLKSISFDHAQNNGIFLDQSWKEIKSGPGSIQEGHALANSAFNKGQFKNVIPVHEPINDVPQAPKVHTGFTGFGQSHGNLGSRNNFGGVGHRGFSFPLQSGKTQSQPSTTGHGLFGSNANTAGGNYFPQGKSQGFKSIQNSVFLNNKSPVFVGVHTGSQGVVNAPIKSSLPQTSYNAGSFSGSYGPPSFNVNHGAVTQNNIGSNGNHFPHQNSGLILNNQLNTRHGYGAFQTPSVYIPSHGQSSHGLPGQSLKYTSSSQGVSDQNSLNFASPGHGTSQTSNKHEAPDSGTPSHGTSSKVTNVHQSNQYGAPAVNHVVPSSHGTNGHAVGHGHDEKATSFQSFIIHSYKPVPVYAKKTEQKYETGNGKNDGSHTEESRNYDHQH